nr:PREDICTED: protein crumbs homolog 3 isoform X1 [Anolis carolinensis]|eukprot:XP_016846627.1 PREDICTED: protein crumbs homolog 3 isoform X1 [Anolis carolinensis]
MAGERGRGLTCRSGAGREVPVALRRGSRGSGGPGGGAPLVPFTIAGKLFRPDAQGLRTALIQKGVLQPAEIAQQCWGLRDKVTRPRLPKRSEVKLKLEPIYLGAKCKQPPYFFITRRTSPTEDQVKTFGGC